MVESTGLVLSFKNFIVFITRSECCEDAGSDALGLGMDLRALGSHKSPGDGIPVDFPLLFE